MTIEYIAGFFDGEGTIHIKDRKVRLTISQTNKEVLDEIKQFFGMGGVLEVTKRKAHWKDAWMYYSGSNKNSYDILCKLDGHLILKQPLLKRARKLLEDFLTEKAVNNRKKLDAISLVNQGFTYRQAEEKTGISRQTICNTIKKIKNG